MYFETKEKPFYCHSLKDNQTFCADKQYLLFGEKSEEIRKCRTMPGKRHNHEVVSQEMLELVAIRWECLLRIVFRSSQETNLQLVELVVSSWPHELSFPSCVLELTFYETLNRFRKWTKNNEEFVQTFLDQHGEEKLAHFRQVVLQYRSAPVQLCLGKFLK